MPSREEKAWQHYRVDKTLRQARKEIKRNRKRKRVRRKSWVAEDWEDLDCAQTERIVPRGERERRRRVLTSALGRLEAETSVASQVPLVVEVEGPHGVVIEVSTGLCRVELGERTVLCAVRGTLSAEDMGFTNIVAVGDEVVVSLDGADRGVVEAVLPRRSALVRPDVFRSHLQQVVVANADQLLVVSSWRDPAIWLELIDRYLISAERNGLLPVICVNKVDLAEGLAACRAVLQPYVELGYQVLFTSALTGESVSDLRQVLAGQTTVLAGLSGVGKSSLLAAVQPGLELRIGAVSARHHEGRHTTAQVTLLRLGMDSSVVDTPGIREFGLSGLRQAELAGFYAEILAVADSCQFADCSHIHEPGCAVRLAVRRGQISAARYHNYKTIYHSLPT